MFLNYFALGVLVVVFLVIFYGVIIIHDIPYEIAKKRNHPSCRCHPCRGVGQSFYLACYMAILMDMGNALSSGTRVGNAGFPKDRCVKSTDHRARK